jgi:hypothetical protein
VLKAAASPEDGERVGLPNLGKREAEPDMNRWQRLAEEALLEDVAPVLLLGRRCGGLLSAKTEQPGLQRLHGHHETTLGTVPGPPPR